MGRVRDRSVATLRPDARLRAGDDRFPSRKTLPGIDFNLNLIMATIAPSA
jgi:hypothetical protein